MRLIKTQFMKAVQIYSYGEPDVMIYEDAPMPQIKDDEVLVKIYASGVNPIDWKVRKGLARSRTQYKFPLILGWDMCGIISEIGKDVTEFKKNDRVFGRPDTSRNGTYAEYIAVRANEISFAPKLLDGYSAAGIPLAGLTAWQAIFDHGKLDKGKRILIQGASGGVGTFAVQFARWKDAYIIGTSSEKNRQFLMDLGANEVLDYHKENYEKKYSDIDIVLDTIGGETQKKSLSMLKPGGILVSTVGIADEKIVKEKGLIGIGFMAKSLPEQLKQIAQLADAGKVRPIIDHILPLSAAVEAHRMSEAGHIRGKIILTISE